MKFEEFSEFGCYKCGGHNFDRPIGENCLVCLECQARFDLEHVGQLDGDFWLQLQAEANGGEYVPPEQVRYHNEEQFIQNMVESVDGEAIEAPEDREAVEVN